MDVKLLQIGKEVNNELVMDFLRLIKKELYQSNSQRKNKERIVEIASIKEIAQSID